MAGRQDSGNIMPLGTTVRAQTSDVARPGLDHLPASSVTWGGTAAVMLSLPQAWAYRAKVQIIG